MQVLAKGDCATIPLDKADRGVLVTATLLWDGRRHAKDNAAARGPDLYVMFVRRAEIAPRSARSGPVGRVSRGLGRKKDKADAARVVYYRNLGSLSEEPFLRLDGPREPSSETVRISSPTSRGMCSCVRIRAQGPARVVSPPVAPGPWSRTGETRL